MTNVCTGAQSVGNETEVAENGAKKTECDEQKGKLKTHLICVRHSSLLISRAGSVQEALTCQAIQVEGRDEPVAMKDIGGDDGNGKQSCMVGTTSSGNIDSVRVEEVESQHVSKSTRGDAAI